VDKNRQIGYPNDRDMNAALLREAVSRPATFTTGLLREANTGKNLLSPTLGLKRPYREFRGKSRHMVFRSAKARGDSEMESMKQEATGTGVMGHLSMSCRTVVRMERMRWLLSILFLFALTSCMRSNDTLLDSLKVRLRVTRVFAGT